MPLTTFYQIIWQSFLELSKLVQKKRKNKTKNEKATYISWLMGMGVIPVILYLLIWSCWWIVSMRTPRNAFFI
jgi:hypothetical protein